MQTPSQTNYGYLKMKLAILSLAAAATLSTSAFAAVTVDGGKINFKGDVVEAPCAVSTSSGGQTVTLGQYTTRTLNAADKTTAIVPFDITLNQCDTTAAHIGRIGFSGQLHSGVADKLALAAVGNGAVAQNVAIQLLDSKQAVLKVDGTFGADKALVNETNVFNFGARYIATGVATAGAANAVVDFSVQYD